MPRYYCDYCDTYLTHDSPAVRKQHNTGYKHKVGRAGRAGPSGCLLLDLGIDAHAGCLAMCSRAPHGAAYCHRSRLRRPMCAATTRNSKLKRTRWQQRNASGRWRSAWVGGLGRHLRLVWCWHRLAPGSHPHMPLSSHVPCSHATADATWHGHGHGHAGHGHADGRHGRHGSR